jgi:hypothetical protein
MMLSRSYWPSVNEPETITASQPIHRPPQGDGHERTGMSRGWIIKAPDRGVFAMPTAPRNIERS